MSAAPERATAEPAGSLRERYVAVRRATERLRAPLSDEDCVVQSMEDASPVKWHLAHTTWFFETFVLEPAQAGFAAFDASFRELFNSYYNSVGAQFARPRRGMLSRPPLAEVERYRAHVDEALLKLLSDGAGPEVRDVVELGLHHEQQHQELIVTDVKHMLSANPTHPVYAAAASRETAAGAGASGRSGTEWIGFEGGEVEIGLPAEAGGFHFDNEAPAHRQLLLPYSLARRPVSAGEYLAFVRDGGYARPELWLSEGWARVQAEGWRAPLYWREIDGAWQHYTLRGLEVPESDAPVCHLSYFEADAYASWAGARLPTESESEHAAKTHPVWGSTLEDEQWHPVSADTAAQSAGGFVSLFGDVWEWTQSSYAAYPGYRPPPGALGEYNGKFMCNQYVLRGGSCATPRGHIRATYRNFFPAHARWQFSGLRLAKDL